mgnify:CR=1 FL=1
MSKTIYRGGKKGDGTRVVMENKHLKTIYDYRPDGSKRKIEIHKPRPHYRRPSPPVVIVDRPDPAAAYLNGVLAVHAAANVMESMAEIRHDYRELRREKEVTRRMREVLLKEDELRVRELMVKAREAEVAALEAIEKLKRMSEKKK